MPRSKIKLVAIILAVVLGGAWSWPANQKSAANKRASKQTAVDRARIVNADKEPGNWMTHGRTYDEQRFSPLKQINADNVRSSALAWSFDLDTDRGQEATPLVVDGVMYFTSAWSKVFALDAATGKLLWSYDPKVPARVGRPAPAATWSIAASRSGSGKFSSARSTAAWSRSMRRPASRSGRRSPSISPGRYTITGAPRVVKGQGDHRQRRRRVRRARLRLRLRRRRPASMLWRFYTVPGDPSKPFESAGARDGGEDLDTASGGSSAAAARSGTRSPTTPSSTCSTSAPATARRGTSSIRSPGGGDNLFLSSIVALNADTGEYVWHYQTTPGETWDYTATQQIILADLAIDGRQRKVMMQAPKNGFFYVLDRATGELISAKPYTFVTWATGIDMKTGRPVETVNARYPGAEGVPLAPGPLGAHNWQPMSFSPLTGLVYIPVQDMGFLYKSQADYQLSLLGFNTGARYGRRGTASGSQD